MPVTHESSPHVTASTAPAADTPSDAETRGTRPLNGGRPFLTAWWVNLAMVNYAIPPALLSSILPIGCTPDLAADGQAGCSLVAFEFKNARVFGRHWPWHVNFPEFNLRCYVKRDGERGVFFVREFVPRQAIALAARWIYNEPYQAVKMRCDTTETAHSLSVDHHFRVGRMWHRLKVSADAPAVMPAPGDPADWYKEQCWGFGTSHRGRALTYEVRHPRWALYPNARIQHLTLNAAAVYGRRWAVLDGQSPESVLLAKGSAVSVSPFEEATS